MKRISGLFILLLILVSCDGQEKASTDHKDLIISAAASLSDALKEISMAFEEKHANIDLTFNLGGSGKLAQQIQRGAPADVFLSADQHWMNVLKNDNLILPRTKIDFTKNNLVMITKEENNLNINSLADINPDTIGQIAIGNPGSVPAGSYTKEALTKLGLWKKLSSHFVYAKDVRQVVTYVESGNVEAGFVYGSDLQRTEKVHMITEVDSDLYTSIVYPGAVLAASDHPDAAKKFLEFLQSSRAQSILEKYGFN